MKQITFTLLLLISIGLVSCRKDRNDPDAKQNDDAQIKNYIAANAITGMQRDTTDGDTTGIYYKILSPGTSTTPLEYSDQVNFVYTVRTLDGKYISTDSLNLNHYYGFVGHISRSQLTSNPPLPSGLQIAVHNLIKYKGTSARVIIPSHLGFGINGYGTGSSSNANSHVGGNQSLDYYINVVSNQELYEDAIIKNYLKANSLTGYVKQPDGVYIKVATPGTGTDAIGTSSYYTVDYTAKYLNDTQLDTGADFPFSNDGSASSNTPVEGVIEGLTGQTAGASVSLIVPSRFAYGQAGNANGGLGPNVTIRFDFTVKTVTN